MNMKFYEIKLKGIPSLTFAHGYRTGRYKMHLNETDSFIEITYIMSGAIEQVYPEGESLLVPRSNIWSFFHDEPRIMQSCSDEEHHHLSIGISVPHERRELCAREVIECEKQAYKALAAPKNARNGEPSNSLTVILPEIIYADEEKSEAVKYIKKLINFHAASDYTRELRCTGLLIEFMGIMTKNSVKLASAELCERRSYSNELYANHAAMYVSKHIGEKIYVEDISKELGISYGYLSKIFKDEMGMSLVDYINTIKIERIKELLLNRDVSFEDAGASVGINDVKYLSRIFKKYTGITSGEYRRQYSDREVSSAIDIVD